MAGLPGQTMSQGWSLSGAVTCPCAAAWRGC